MSDRSKRETQSEHTNGPGDVLRQALMRLTSPQVEDLQSELIQLERQIDALKKLEGDAAQLHILLDETHSKIKDIEEKFRLLGDEIRDPAMVEQRLRISMVPTLHGQARGSQGEDVAEALAPVIGPAILHQIRDAKEVIINALYPVIGQIINKAISESLRELTRNIDARLRRQLNFRDRIDQFFNRLRGVTGAELLLRGAIPYSIERIFLIHRDTGILLAHLAVNDEGNNEMATVSAMLTAIQDFVRDSFSGGEGDLEEVAHGDLRILLESGQFAYVAVVLNGIEPEGYNNLINEVVHQINFQHESELRKFDGNMVSLPNFEPQLGRLLSPDETMLSESSVDKPLSRPQKRLITIGLVAVALLVALTIFACIYTVRLWPIVFPPAIASPSATAIPSLISLPSLTPTLVPTSTNTPVSTATLVPSPSPSPTTLTQLGVLSGNLNVRFEPSTSSVSHGVVMSGEQVIIKDRQGDWFLISWPVGGEPGLSGWIMGVQFLEFPEGYSP